MSHAPYADAITRVLDHLTILDDCLTALEESAESVLVDVPEHLRVPSLPGSNPGYREARHDDVAGLASGQLSDAILRAREALERARILDEARQETPSAAAIRRFLDRHAQAVSGGVDAPQAVYSLRQQAAAAGVDPGLSPGWIIPRDALERWDAEAVEPTWPFEGSIIHEAPRGDIIQDAARREIAKDWVIREGYVAYAEFEPITEGDPVEQVADVGLIPGAERERVSIVRHSDLGIEQ